MRGGLVSAAKSTIITGLPKIQAQQTECLQLPNELITLLICHNPRCVSRKIGKSLMHRIIKEITCQKTGLERNRHVFNMFNLCCPKICILGQPYRWLLLTMFDRLRGCANSPQWHRHLCCGHGILEVLVEPSVRMSEAYPY